MRILNTGSGGSLGRLLYAVRNNGAVPETDVIFQSGRAGRDLCWPPETPFDHLPACDTLVALWGWTSGTAEELAENVQLVALSRQVAQSCDTRRVFHISSAAVYGSGKALTEGSQSRPLGLYGQSKAAMETAIWSSPENFGEHVVRPANVVGADSLAPSLGVKSDLELDQFADGRGPIRSYVRAIGLLQCLCGLSALDNEALPFAINVSAPDPEVMDDLALAAKQRVSWHPAPPGAVKEISLNVGILQVLLPEARSRSNPVEIIDDLYFLEGRT